MYTTSHRHRLNSDLSNPPEGQVKRNVQRFHRPLRINKCALKSSRPDPAARDVVQSQEAVGWTHQDAMLADVECGHPGAMHCGPYFQDAPPRSVNDQKLSHTRVAGAVPSASFILSDLHPAYLCVSVTCQETSPYYSSCRKSHAAVRNISDMGLCEALAEPGLEDFLPAFET